MTWDGSYYELPDYSVLHEWFRYVKVTGFMYWRKCPGPRINDLSIPIGYTAIMNPNFTGYLGVKLFKQGYRQSRIIWKMITGNDPFPFIVEHRNLIKKDNRWSNLRLATLSLNQRNVVLRKDSSSGHKGIWWNENEQRWRAQIVLNGKRVQRNFRLKKDAIDFCEDFCHKHFGEFHRWGGS